MNIKILVHIELLYFVKKREIVNFDRFGVKHIPEEIKKFIDNKNVKANIFRVHMQKIAQTKLTDQTKFRLSEIKKDQ